MTPPIDMRDKTRVLVAPWLVSLAVLTSLGGCGAGGERVASVKGHAIAVATFRHWLAIVAAESGEPANDLPEPPHYASCVRRLLSESAKSKAKPTTAALTSNCASRYRALTQATLGFLIPAEWVLAEAQHLGIAVSDAKVKQEFVRAERQRFARVAEFRRFLASSRYTVSDVLLRVKLSLVSAAIRRKVVDEHSKVTPTELERYYSANKARFGAPEKRAVYIIRTNSERAAKNARDEIESGKSFSSVARNVSLDPSAKTSGGLAPEVVKGQYPTAVDQAIFSARANVLTGPIRSTLGYYLLSVKRLTSATTPPLSEVKGQVAAQLTSANESKGLSSFIEHFRTRWTKATECNSGYVVMQCSEYKGPRAE